MKARNFYSFLLVFCSIVFTTLYAAEEETALEDLHLDEKDIEALREWVKSKKQQVMVKEKGGSLIISGEVRVELQSFNEKRNGVKQRGSGGAFPDIASNAWDIELNLMLDYRTDRTWAAVKLEFDNNAGTVGGTLDRLKLERAYLGGRVLDSDDYTLDLEIGRRRFSDIFDSKIQFGSFMDGILGKYSQWFDALGDFYIYGGPFLINESVNQYGYIAELGLLTIGNTGLYSKISWIDWDTKDYSNPLKELAFAYMNTQWTWGYKCAPSWFGSKMTTFYIAGLINTAARATKVTRHSKENLAWYAGFSVGEIRKKGDWSLDINYQWVQAQTIPDFEGAGIGRGNAAEVGLYSTKWVTKGLGKATSSSTAVGAGNYRGPSITFNYMLTDTITVFQSYSQSSTLNKNIGPNLQYKMYEIELIYGF